MAFGVYLHVPFCAHRCPYCDFSFVVRQNPPTERFTAALLREIEAANLPPADTIYFGGGTPSLLEEQQIGTILAHIPKYPGTSVTLEANPDDVGKFEPLARIGIGRLSIGIQSLHQRHLTTLGRTHSAAAARRAVQAAVQVFQDVNADLIFGIPDQSVSELLADAQWLVDAGVQHISAYGLTVHEGTLLAKAVKKGAFRTVAENAEREHFLALDAFLRARGLEHYEISNYARPGFRSTHNELYWTGAPYRGFGPSAHSFDPQAHRRYWNLRTFDRWLAAIEQGASPLEGEEMLNPAEQRVERLYLALRRSEGLAREALPQSPAAKAIVAAAEREGLVYSGGARLALTPEGMAIADTVVESLLSTVE